MAGYSTIDNITAAFRNVKVNIVFSHDVGVMYKINNFKIL